MVEVLAYLAGIMAAGVAYAIALRLFAFAMEVEK